MPWWVGGRSSWMAASAHGPLSRRGPKFTTKALAVAALYSSLIPLLVTCFTLVTASADEGRHAIEGGAAALARVPAVLSLDFGCLFIFFLRVGLNSVGTFMSGVLRDQCHPGDDHLIMVTFVAPDGIVTSVVANDCPDVPGSHGCGYRRPVLTLSLPSLAACRG